MTKAAEQRLRESLSAAIDGEAEPLELRRVLNAVAEDADLLARWRSAHVVGSVIRGEATAAEARPPPLEDTPADGPDRAALGRRWRWLGPVASGAVAAGAALAVVLVFGRLDTAGSAPGTAGSAADMARVEQTQPGPGQRLLADGQSPAGPLVAPSEQDVRRANTYLLHHARHAAVSARPAAMPFVKALAQDGRVRTVAVPDGTTDRRAALR